MHLLNKRFHIVAHLKNEITSRWNVLCTHTITQHTGI